jgi:hypothetical protein
LRITPRSGWNARPPKSKRRINLPTARLWLHHTATDAWHGPSGVRACQSFHMNSRGYSDIAYSFLIDDNGAIFEGRGAGIAGGHTKGDNTSSHAICFMGDFTKRAPTDESINAAAWLVRHGHEQGWWADHITGGHRQAPGAQTACPGDRLLRMVPTINQLAAPEDSDLTEDERKMLSRIHHEVVVGVKGDRPDTIAQMLERLLDRVEAIEKKLA